MLMMVRRLLYEACETSETPVDKLLMDADRQGGFGKLGFLLFENK